MAHSSVHFLRHIICVHGIYALSKDIFFDSSNFVFSQSSFLTTIINQFSEIATLPFPKIIFDAILPFHEKNRHFCKEDVDQYTFRDIS